MTDPAPTRRSFLSYAAGGGVAVGALVAGAGVMRSCSPTSDIMASRDARLITPLQTGQMEIRFGDHPILFKRLTSQQKTAISGSVEDLQFRNINRYGDVRDNTPATAHNILYGTDNDLLVLSLLCPRRSCVLTQNSGDWSEEGGFFCHCYGTHFDGVGRWRKGIAPQNMYSPALAPQNDGAYLMSEIPSNWNTRR